MNEIPCSLRSLNYTGLGCLENGAFILVEKLVKLIVADILLVISNLVPDPSDIRLSKSVWEQLVDSLRKKI